MTLDESKTHQKLKVIGIKESALKETRIAIKEAGLFKGDSICKLCENRTRCAIYQLHGCHRIMLHLDFSKMVEVEVEEEVAIQ